MLKLLRGKPQEAQPTHRGALDIKRYTRIEPRETRTMNQKAYTRFATEEPPKAAVQTCALDAASGQIVRKVALPKPPAPTPAPTPAPVQRAEQPNLAAHLHSEAPVSIALLRRALPQRFREVEARKQDALSTYNDPLKYAFT